MLVFAGMMAVAQTSVWNGDRTIWTKGSGTESDPYLLESAEHLAYFAYVVNKGFNTTGMHFLLTTDIDLNGSEDLPWVPIGLGNRWFSEDGCNRGTSSGFYDSRPFFRGHFNGGNHSVSNIYVDGENNPGLFGWAQGTVETPTVIENVFVISGTVSGNTCGGILGRGTNTLVSHCWNGASISGTNAGGIVGEGGEVLDCYNTGHVTGTKTIGGIVGQNALVIEGCYNNGTVEGMDAQAVAGGLLGSHMMVSLTINNCYNTGTVSALGGEGSNYPAAGGLIGRQIKSCEITNCYNVGEVSGSNHVGCLIGLSLTAASVENCYYLDACTESEYGTASSGDYMRSQQLVDILNSGNTDPVWALDSDGINNGFPVLSGQYYRVEVEVTPSEGGTVMGDGIHGFGALVTLTATASEGYAFVNWIENGEVVSTDPTYLFTVTGDRKLVANFSGAGVNESVSMLRVSPNPVFARGEVRLGLPTAEKALVEIYNPLGVKVMSKETSDGRIVLSPAVVPGTYIMKVVSASGAGHYCKLIVE